MAEKKYDLALRGRDVTIRTKLVFGPWHSFMHLVQDDNGVMLGIFESWSAVLDFLLGSSHRTQNLQNILIAAAEERFRVSKMFEDAIRYIGEIKNGEEALKM
jgi:hypothetical protein